MICSVADHGGALGGAQALGASKTHCRTGFVIHKLPAGCGIARVVVQMLIQKCKPSQYFCLFDDVFWGVPDPFIFKAESAETQAPAQNPLPFLSRAVLNFHASCLK